MPENDDVSRLAAALGAPGLRYRSFGNEPVRVAAPNHASPSMTFPLSNAAPGPDSPAPPAEETRPTMRFIADTPLPATSSVAAPPQPSAPPEWPLLAALYQPPEPPVAEPPRGTLVQLLAGIGQAAPPVAMPPRALSGLAAPQPAFGWPAPPAPAAPAVLPAARVPGSLSEVFQTLAHGVTANPTFAALRRGGAGGTR